MIRNISDFQRSISKRRDDSTDERRRKKNEDWIARLRIDGEFRPHKVWDSDEERFIFVSQPDHPWAAIATMLCEVEDYLNEHLKS